MIKQEHWKKAAEIRKFLNKSGQILAGFKARLTGESLKIFDTHCFKSGRQSGQKVAVAGFCPNFDHD